MKKILAIAIAALSMLFVSSCGVGNYTVVSGQADEGELSFYTTVKTKQPVNVTVDDSEYSLLPVFQKAYRTDRDIKKTTQNTVIVKPGAHTVVVVKNGAEVYNQKVFISAGDHKLIEVK